MSEVAKTVWKLFEETGQIGYYNLYMELMREEQE